MSEENIRGNLQLFWSNFLKIEIVCDEKNKWLELFLHEFKKIEYDQDGNRKLVNSNISECVSSELSKYMLLLIYDLCSSNSSSNEKTDDKDLESVLSLRSFLVDGLGGRILKCLSINGTKNIINSREFANVLVRLFPTKNWGYPLTKVLNDEEDFIKMAENVLKFKIPSNYGETRRNSSQSLHIKRAIKIEKVHYFDDSLEINEENFDILNILIDSDDFQDENSDENLITQDDISLLILNILEDIILNENIMTIDHNAVSISCIQFVIDHLKRSECPKLNDTVIKKRLIYLIMLCLNNVFLMENIAEEYINLESVCQNFVEILKRELKVSGQEELIYGIVYTTLATINNTFIFFNENIVNEKYFLVIFKHLDRNVDTLKHIFGYFDEKHSPLEKKIVEIFLKIMKNFKNSQVNVKISSKKRKRIQKSHHRSKQNSQINYICTLENILIALFPVIKMSDKKLLLNFFDKNQICCCNSNVKTLEIIMKMSDLSNIGGNFGKNIVCAIFSESQCDVCESEKYSNNFQDNFTKIYQSLFVEYVKRENKNKLSQFLRHILDIIRVIPFKLSRFIMVEIVIKVFSVFASDSDEEDCNEIINNCLKIISASLNDVNLFKLFVTEENIERLKVLSTFPEHVHQICKILKVAIENNQWVSDTSLSSLVNEILFDNIKNLTILLNNCIFNLASHSDLKIDIKLPKRRKLTYTIPLQNITTLKIEYWKTCISLLSSKKSSALCFRFLYEFTDEAFDLIYNLFSLILYNNCEVSDVKQLSNVETDKIINDNLKVNRDDDLELDRTEVYQESSVNDDSILELFSLKQLIDGYYSKRNVNTVVEDCCDLVKNSSVKKKLAVIFELILCCYLQVIGENVDLADKMSSALWELKKLLLNSAFENWNSIEYGKTAIVALQSLLKVAEIREPCQCSCQSDDYFSLHNSDVKKKEYDGEESSSNESFTTADDGYEGDVENNIEIFNNLNESNDGNCTEFKINENVCKLVIEILIDLSSKCSTCPENWTNLLADMVHKLNMIRKYLGGSVYLLKGFATVLEQNDKKLEKFQKSILDLVSDLNTRQSFGAFMALFALENPPVEILFRKLHSLFENVNKVQCYNEITFTPKETQIRTCTCEFLLAKKINFIREHHLYFNLKSPFTEAAIVVPLNPLNFYPWSENGFTASMWLKFKPPNQVNKKEIDHLLSVGDEKQILSLFLGQNSRLYVKFSKPDAIVTPNNTKMYLNNRVNISCCDSCAREFQLYHAFKQNPDGNTLMPIFKIEALNAQCVYCYRHLSNENVERIMNSATDLDYIVHEVILPIKSAHLEQNQWNLVTFAVQQKEKVIAINVTIDGVQKHALEIENTGKIHIITNVSMICIGQNVIVGKEPIYSLTNVNLFQKYLTNPEFAMNLYAIGPNHYATLNPESAMPNYGVLKLNKIPNLTDFNPFDLSEYLIGVFSSHKPDIFLGFKTNDRNQMQLGMMTFSSDVPKEIDSFQKSILLSGGISTILFMYARIVELSDDPILQSAALKFLLKVAHSNNEFYSEFVNKDYINLIGVILKSKKCKKDVSTLCSIFEVAFDGPVLAPTNAGTVNILKNANSRIIYPDLLLSLFRNFIVWAENDEEILNIILEVLIVSVRDKNPSQTFNINRLTSAGLIHILLNFCRKNFTIPTRIIKISQNAAENLVTLITSLAETPPKNELIIEIVDLLLLMHRPTESFVTHDRFKYYFNLAPFPTKKPNKNTENKLTQKLLLLKGRKIKYSQVRKNMDFSLSSSDESNEVISLNINVSNKNPITTSSSSDSVHYEKINSALSNPIIKRKSLGKDNKCKVRRLQNSDSKRNIISPVNAKIKQNNILRQTTNNCAFPLKYFTTQTPENGNSFVQESFMNALRAYILIIPDEQAVEILESGQSIIQTLLILANNSKCRIRSSIIKLLAVITDRLSTNSINEYTKTMFWHHLGNQIGSYDVNIELLNAIFTWITKSNVGLNLDTAVFNLNISICQKYGLNTLMAILPQSTADSKLFHLVTQLVENIYLKINEAALYMLENGLVWCLVKTLVRLHEKMELYSDASFSRLLEFLTAVSYKAFCSTNCVHIVWDLIHGLMFASKDKNPDIVTGVRNMQAAFLRNILQKCVYKTTESFLKNISFTVSLSDCDSNLSQAEIKTRFNLILDKSVHFLSTFDSVVVSDEERRLFECLLNISLNGNSRTGQIILWSLLPSKPIDLKLFTVKQLCHYLDKGKYLSQICDVKMLKVLAQSMLLINQENISSQDSRLVSQFCNSIDGPQNSSWNLSQILEEIDIIRASNVKDLDQIVHKSVYRNENLVQYCTEMAMQITRNIVEKQNKIRKVLMNHLRCESDYEYYQEWRRIIKNLTHEGNIWHNPNLYPYSWELDQTEGVNMARKRLKRCHMEVDPKFILKDYQSDVNKKYKQLLTYITKMADYHDYSFKEQVIYTFNVKHITVNHETDGECIITESQFILATVGNETVAKNLLDITEILARRYQHRESALELFFTDGNSILLVFPLISEKEAFCAFFENLIDKNSKAKVDDLSQKWRDGELTNFEYLMTLNRISGRTFNDLMQYPVFPWILNDYDGQNLNLLNENVFRNFEKPIAIQNKDLEKHYVNNYNYLKSALSDSDTRNIQPYHYSSHYSNSGTVLHFLVRTLPFTSLFLQYQDNNFDIPDRTFHSMNTTWLLASKDSPTDVKELIPEFFYLPEFLENLEGFDFGLRQSGEPVNHVQLPSWSQNSSRLFTLIYRQALESGIVRSQINHWIDLIFGYKQTGQPAIDAINVFHPATYSTFTSGEIIDPVERLACETMVKTYGQMPKQLFDSPHPTVEVADRHPKIPVLDTVIGLKWGQYAGSPDFGEPIVSQMLSQKLDTFSLVHLENEDKIFCIPSNCNVIKGDKLIFWNEIDDICRIKPYFEDLIPEADEEKLFYPSKLDSITCCGTHLDIDDIWFGHKSGKMTIFKRKLMKCQFFNSYQPKVRRSNTFSSNIFSFGRKKKGKITDDENMEWEQPIIFVKHCDKITGIKISYEFKIVVSVSLDGTAAIWDLNKMEYIREIPQPVNVLHSAITLAAISPTLGDILTVHASTLHNKIQTSCPSSLMIDDEESFEVTENNIDDYVKIAMCSRKCQIRLYTINAKYVNHVFVDDNVTAVNYSYAKEGGAVNSVAVSLESGIIKLFSSWNLALVKEINTNSFILDLLYSTNQYLIVLTNDHVIQVWKSEDILNAAPPKFIQVDY